MTLFSHLVSQVVGPSQELRSNAQTSPWAAKSCGKLQSLLQHYKLSYSICCGDGAHAHTLDPQGLSAPSTQVNFAP